MLVLLGVYSKKLARGVSNQRCRVFKIVDTNTGRVNIVNNFKVDACLRTGGKIIGLNVGGEHTIIGYGYNELDFDRLDNKGNVISSKEKRNKYIVYSIETLTEDSFLMKCVDYDGNKHTFISSDVDDKIINGLFVGIRKKEKGKYTINKAIERAVTSIDNIECIEADF